VCSASFPRTIEQRAYLDRLAEAHLIRQNAAAPTLPQSRHPSDTKTLVAEETFVHLLGELVRLHGRTGVLVVITP
jgi:hypothetical protein